MSPHDAQLAKLKYRDPSTMDYRSHVAHVRTYNQLIQRELTQQLDAHMHRLNVALQQTTDAAVFTMGSDGRLEKGPVSPIELAVCSRPDAVVPIDNAYLKQALSDIGVIHLVDKDIEQRSLDDRLSYTSVTSPAGQETMIPSPGRIFDANIIFGAPEIYDQMLEKVFEETRGPGQGKSTYSRMHRKARDAIRWISTGVQSYKTRQVRHYNPNSGEVFYDEEESRWGLKQGPMRAIQFSLVDDTLREIRAGADYEVVKALPKHTSDKLRAISLLGWTPLSPESIEQLADCYDWFLWTYHQSQWAHRSGYDMILVDAPELKERLNTVDCILSQTKEVLSLKPRKSTV